MRQSRRPGHGHRHRKDGIGPQVAFVPGAIPVEHNLVDGFLIKGRLAGQGRIYDVVDISHGLQDAGSAETSGVLIPQLQGFIAAGAGPGGNGGMGADAIVQAHFGLNRGIAPGIQHFPAADFRDNGGGGWHNHSNTSLPAVWYPRLAGVGIDGI